MIELTNEEKFILEKILKEEHGDLYQPFKSYNFDQIKTHEDAKMALAKNFDYSKSRPLIGTYISFLDKLGDFYLDHAFIFSSESFYMKVDKIFYIRNKIRKIYRDDFDIEDNITQFENLYDKSYIIKNKINTQLEKISNHTNFNKMKNILKINGYEFRGITEFANYFSGGDFYGILNDKKLKELIEISEIIENY